ncbi:MAG: hypothetical protein ACYDG2_03755 [Ruminiclostridium sp.]
MNEIKIRVPYVSVWDGGIEIATSINLNIRTGEVTNFEKLDPLNTVQDCERAYIILNNEQVDVFSEDGNGYWVQLHNGYAGPCTDNYIAEREAISGLSIAEIVKAVDYMVALSQFLNDDNEILNDLDNILEPFYTVINQLRTEEICRHGGCGSYLYKSDLPQYDFVCPECSESF